MGWVLWVDVLRGFTMLLVIYSHIDIMENNSTTAINQVLLLVRMPLFFFISIIQTSRNTVCELPVYFMLSFMIASVCIFAVVLLKHIGLKEWIFP